MKLEGHDLYIRDTWFRSHKAEYVKPIVHEMEMISWRQPNKSSYYVLYLRMSNYLQIYGDVGIATYNAGLRSFKEWADCDFHYFSGKCVSSEYGTRYLEWDKEVIKKDVIRALKNNGKSWDEFCQKGGDGCLTYKDEWIQWLYEYGDDFFGYERIYWPVKGQRIATYCRAHLIGLKMAMEQLNI